MPVREVMGGDRCLWTVWDTYPESARRVNVMPGYEAGWLTFECDGEKRRLFPVPPDWTTAPDEELLRWLASAAVVQKSRLPGG